MKKVLVTGAAGVLGTALLPQLIQAGYQVRGMSRRVRLSQDSPVEWVQADLETGMGLAEAVKGVDTIIHAASNPSKLHQADVLGTERLLEQATGVSHVIYVSIVGIDRIPFSFYRHKLAVERVVEQASLPYSIARITQFHTLIDMLLNALTRWPVAPLPADLKSQPIDPGEAAKWLVESVAAGPAGRLPDIGGPEVLSLGEMARVWLTARGLRRWVIPLPIPGRAAAGLRQGLNTVPEGAYGRITWVDWVSRQYGQELERERGVETPARRTA